jgi:hypothetical protein
MLAALSCAILVLSGCGGTDLKSSSIKTAAKSMPGGTSSSSTTRATTGAAAGTLGGDNTSSGSESAPRGEGWGTQLGAFRPHVHLGLYGCTECFTPNGSTASPLVPANAVEVHGIQNLSGWLAATDTSGGGGSASGATQTVGMPSLSGSAREFTTTFADSGDERYYVSFGEDPESNNFLFDGWIYVASPSSDIANLEMDLNQVLKNGQTVIFGFQCDGYSGTWDYTENAGTPANPLDVWVHSTEACNPRNWATDAWHHVQISFARDDAGNVTYKAAWLDGTEQVLNVTVPSAFALGWSSVLLTNFQVDGLGSGGSPTVYLDELNVYRW